jgi:hypothetical protein
MRQVRRGIVALGLLLALVPLSAQAEDGNQAAIDKARAEKTALDNLSVFQQGVVLGQYEIANARAIAKLLSYDAHAQTEIPNSLQQYNAFCDTAISYMQAKVANASAMAANKPWDMHAQDELANANAMNRSLWTMIGDTYPGNPYKQVRGPSQVPVLSDDQAWVADDQAMVAGDEEMFASTDEVAVVAEDAPEVAAD